MEHSCRSSNLPSCDLPDPDLRICQSETVRPCPIRPRGFNDKENKTNYITNPAEKLEHKYSY